MARINSNIPSLVAQEKLNRSQREMGVRLERLSSGLKINRGKDDPAGLIISERIRSNIRGIENGVKNGAPKHMEWYAGYALLVTLVWLYIELLRLLAKLNSRK
jgi:hypothetical protein